MATSHETRAERYERHRHRYLPDQLAAARRRVVHLEREAARLGMHDLLRPEKQA